MSSDINCTRLENGLAVLTLESHSAPVASFWIWYRVGARNEVPGITGISHWVEHMLFKGTPKFGKGAITDVITRNGGVLNGMTSLDWTTYYETLPSDRIELALEIEADRMQHAIFDPAEVESERTVIISEREGNENNPLFYLNEELASAAFRIHPYGQGVIGFKCDLRSITREDLYAHYRRFYGPNNAVAVAVGDFETDKMLDLIRLHFGSISPIADPPAVRAIEPAPEGERRVAVHRPAATAYYAVGYHAPAASSSDFYSLEVLDAILSGGQTPGSGTSRGASGRTARLYRALVDKGLATYAGSAYRATKDPYLFTITATARPSVRLEEIEEVVNSEIGRLRDERVSADELARAIKQASAGFIYSSEGVTNKARYLGYLEMVNSYRMFPDFVENLEQVTADDVQRVAATYLTELRRTVGWLIPAGAGGTRADAEQAAAAWFEPPVAGWSDSRSGRAALALPKIERRQMANDITVIGNVNPADPSIALKVALRAGSLNDPVGKDGLANFVALALPRGSQQRDALAVSELLDSLGAGISVDAGTSVVEFNLKCLSEDFEQVFHLLTEIIRQPAFPSDEVDKLRGEILTSIKERQNDTRSVADRRFHELAYPEGHPYHRPTIGYEDTVSGFTVDDARDFYDRFYQPQLAVVAYSGNVPFERVADLVERELGDWQSKAPPKTEIPDVSPPTSIERAEVVVPGKTQSDIVLGRPGIRRNHEDYYALSVANFILGRSAIKGRLGDVVREQQGLAYYVYSQLQAGFGPGPWAARAGVNPANVDQAIASIQHEIERFLESGATDEELADVKGFLTGAMPLSLETNGGIARALLDIELHQLGLDYLERYPKIIEALTHDDVLSAARRHLSAEGLVLVIAGPDRAQAT